MSERPAPKHYFSKGWYARADDEIEVAMDAILTPDSVTPESHYQYQSTGRKASPIIDKTLLLGVTIDLVHDLWYRLQRAEDQIRRLEQRWEGVDRDGVDDGDGPSLDSVEPR